MTVIRNTYPTWPNVAHAEPGDEVEWAATARQMTLVRKADGKTVYSRDNYPRDQEDPRPMIGIIASVKSKSWFLEIAP